MAVVVVNQVEQQGLKTKSRVVLCLQMTGSSAVAMVDPFWTMRGNKFAFGQVHQRG